MEIKVTSFFFLHLKLHALFSSKIFPSIKEFFHFSAVCLSLLSQGWLLSRKYNKALEIRKKEKKKNIKPILMIGEYTFNL